MVFGIRYTIQYGWDLFVQTHTTKLIYKSHIVIWSLLDIEEILIDLYLKKQVMFQVLSLVRLNKQTLKFDQQV